jgi:hypothetical protein
MKRFTVIPSAIVLGLAGCDTMSRPITSGDFDPLRKPGEGMNGAVANSGAFRPGQFVRAIMDNTAFFNTRPKGDSDADKLLTRGTSMKVISLSDSYVKVELDSGEVGWVPALMIEDPNAAPSADGGFGTLNPGEYQVYPPTGGYGGELPPVNPGEMPPEGAIPTVIDPEAPANTDPIPPVTVPDDAFPTPPAPLPEPVPPKGNPE